MLSVKKISPPEDSIPPPPESLPLVLFRLTVLLTNETSPDEVEIPPPSDLSFAVLFPLTVLLTSETLAESVAMPPPFASASFVLPPVTVKYESVRVPVAALEKLTTRLLSSNKSSASPAVSAKLASTSVMKVPGKVMSSPLASPVMVTSVAIEASMINVSVISSSP